MSLQEQKQQQHRIPKIGHTSTLDRTKINYSLSDCIKQSVDVLNGLDKEINWKFTYGSNFITLSKLDCKKTFNLINKNEYKNIQFEIALVFVQSIVDILTHLYILLDKNPVFNIENVQTQIEQLVDKVFGKHERLKSKKELEQAMVEKQVEQQNAKKASLARQASLDKQVEQNNARQARFAQQARLAQQALEEQNQNKQNVKKYHAQLDDLRKQCSKQEIHFYKNEKLTFQEIKKIIKTYKTTYDWSNEEGEYNNGTDEEQYNGILIMMVLYNLMMNQSHIAILMSLPQVELNNLFNNNGSLASYKRYIFFDDFKQTNLQFVTKLYFELSCTSGEKCDLNKITSSCNQFNKWLIQLDKNVFLECFSTSIQDILKEFVFEPKLLTYIRLRGDEHGNMSSYNNFEKKEENNKNYLFIQLKNMDKTYVSGPFTNIFFEEDSNDDVANKCTEILKLLNNKESVFVVGYGSSGAGKTSTLINYRYKDSKGDRQSEHGILLNIIKKIDNVSTVTMEIFEDYYGTFKNVTTELQKQLTFQRKSSNADYTLSKGSILNTENIPNKLGECIIFFIDEPKRRRIAATTNNKQSSRSHVIVKLTFTFNNTSGIGTGTAIMYIADYAGVENIFQCNDVGELVKFANIKSNRVNDDSFFYDKEANNEDMQICNKNGSSYNITKNVKNEEVILPSKRADIDKKIVNNSIWENYTTNCFLNPFDYNKENTKLDVFNKNIDEFIHKQSTIETNAIQIENKNQVRQTYYESSQADLSTFVNELKNINTNYFKVSSSETNTYHIYYNLAHTPFVNTSSTVKDELVQIQVINDYHNALIKKYPPLYSYEVNKVEITIESNKKYSYMKLKNRSVTIKNNNVEITFKSDGTKFIPIDARGAKRLASYYNISYRNTTNSVIEFREIYSTFEINVIPFKEIHVQLSNNTKIDNEWKKKSEALKSLYNYYKYCTQRLQDIKGVCKCRAGEGIHINNSIEKMRNHIFKLLSGDRNNFSKTLTYSRCTSGLLPPLVINPIKETPSSEDDDDVKNAMRMAVGDDKVNVVVFGIFNNSPEQDIKTLYVDINNLKYWYYCYCITDIYKLRKEIIPNVLKGILKDYSDETTILKNIKQEIDKIKGMGKELNTYQKKILKNIKDFIAQYDRKNTLSLENVKNIIEMIQRENNTSPIGTLEFMDHMSKMNPEIMPFCNTDQDVIDYDNIFKKKGVNNRVQ